MHLRGHSLSGIIFEDAEHEMTKDICIKLKESGVEARTFWKPIHIQRPYENAIGAESLRNTDVMWSKILTLPCSTNITEDEMETVSNALKKELMNENG